LHNASESICERIMRSFSAWFAHITPSTAAWISSGEVLMFLVRYGVMSKGSLLSSKRSVIAEAALPNTSENTSSNLMLDTVRQFWARFFSPVV
jgi:hypothetical protein